MFFRQYDLACLSLYSYLIGDTTTGRAIVVDPQRDIGEYVADAAAHDLRIERVVETHFHADFLSGHLELAETTGAVVSYGDVAQPDFPIEPLADGQVLSLGEVTLEVRHTPGHTPESISLVVRRHPDDEPWAVLTGDTLFIGDVGRPDLLASVGVTPADLGADLHRSLQRLLGLPDDTLVLPAHGAGSACGKALATETVSTIGEQRRTNYALAPMDERAFVALVTEGQPAAPGYFGYDAALNRRLHPLLDEHEAPRPLDMAGLDEAVASGAVVIDVRPVEDYAGGHLAGSLHIPLGGRFAEQAGTIVAPGTPVVLVGDADAVAEARLRLGRIGFDRVAGAVVGLERELVAHPERAARLSRLTAGQLAERRAEFGERLQLVDVRTPGEVAVAPLAGARNLPLARLRDELAGLDRSEPVVLVCAGGARSAVAAGLLAAEGFTDVSDVLGGYAALTAATSGTGEQ
jgi:hydroxyacylglutathione hydrolase